MEQQGKEPVSVGIGSYNHDLAVSESFSSHFGLLRDLLRDERLLKDFVQYDAIARRHKKSFHRIGYASLLLGTLTLCLAALASAGAPATRSHTIASMVIEGAGALAVVLLAINRFAAHNAKWCHAVFCRERLRQWHFQLFLDGQLLSERAAGPESFRAEVDRRWELLQQQFRDGYGAMMRFLNYSSQSQDLFHPFTPYTDANLQQEVLRALASLRLSHQQGYEERKLAPVSEGIGLVMTERQSLSEALASVALALALLVALLAFAESVFGVVGWQGIAPGLTSQTISGAALFLVVVSAACRAYRSGFTLPEETESYKEYGARISELSRVFDSTEDARERIRVLRDLEIEAAVELRRFLRMKMRATFIA